MKRKKKATKPLQSESEFLGDAPSEIQAVLAWFHDGAERAPVSDEMEHFAGGFLAALYDDGALFPMSKNAAWLLAMVLTQHQRNPTQPIAWLNLGLALRRMALYRSSDPGLWLLYVNALRSAGKEDEAAANLDGAYHAYLLAGQPKELQEIFEKFGPNVPADLTRIH
jgi:hypothetical protein